MIISNWQKEKSFSRKFNRGRMKTEWGTRLFSNLCASEPGSRSHPKKRIPLATVCILRETESSE